jgi:hypothetical protein
MGIQFGAENWRDYIPEPVCDEHPEYNEFYKKAWELAYSHIKFVPGMPQNPYMDEAFCDTQIWIWDTCFMSMFCKYARQVFPGVESLKNFYGVLHGDEHLGVVIPTVKEPDFTEAVPGVPYEMRIHIADNPPLFAWVEYENALVSGDLAHLRDLLYNQCVLQKHYEWFETIQESVTPRGVHVNTCLIAEKLGYRWEGGRSGMDNTPRGRLGDHALGQRPNNPDMLWLDAICQQALSAAVIAKMYGLCGDTENETIWQEKFGEKKKIINEYYWDEQDGFYYDIDCNSLDFYKIQTMASYWTLTAGVASTEQAAMLAKEIENPDAFGGIVPFTSLSRSDNDFSEKGLYWRGSVWLPTAYAALVGLKKYGLHKLTYQASCKLLEHMYKTYTDCEPHTIWECYSPTAYKPATNETGTEALVRPDFCGWSALGPISVYIEFVLGFHTINAFTKTVEWEKPEDITGRIGIQNLSFGNVVTDIVAEDDICKVISNVEYTLVVNGTPYKISAGENDLIIK